MRLRRFGYAAALVILMPGLLSCGSEPGAASNAQAPATHTITMEAVSFQPADLTVRVGDSVVWINKDPFPHTATATGGPFDSKDIAVQQSWVYTPKTPGEFPYKCSYHPTMTGTLRVK